MRIYHEVEYVTNGGPCDNPTTKAVPGFSHLRFVFTYTLYSCLCVGTYCKITIKFTLDKYDPIILNYQILNYLSIHRR